MRTTQSVFEPERGKTRLLLVFELDTRDRSLIRAIARIGWLEHAIGALRVALDPIGDVRLVEIRRAAKGANDR